MEKNRFEVKVRIGRTYYHRGRKYVVRNLSMMQGSDNVAKPHVEYVEEIKPDITFIRELGEFLGEFVPTTLEVGDIIEAISMGKNRGFLVVSDIVEGDEYPVRFKDSALKAKLDVDRDSCNVVLEEPMQATEFRYVRLKINSVSPTQLIIQRISEMEKSLYDMSVGYDEKKAIMEQINQIIKALGL